MGRESNALITRSLPAVADRVEILVARSQLAHRSGPHEQRVANEQFATLLLSFDPKEDDRWAARALAGSYIAAETHFWQKTAAIDSCDWLDQLTSQIPGGVSLSVVLALPDEWSAAVEEQISGFLTAASTGNTRIQLIAAVAGRPADWVNCDGVDGFVACESERRGSTALALWHMACALMAPGLMSAFDPDDLQGMLGTASNPSRVAKAVWMAEDSELVVPTRVRSELNRCTELAFMPATPLAFESLHRLALCTRRLLRPDVGPLAIAPYGLTADLVGTQGLVNINLLCKVGKLAAVGDCPAPAPSSSSDPDPHGKRTWL